MPRDYSSKDKAVALAALDANEGNLRRTARTLNVPKSTLADWRDNKINPEVSALRSLEKNNLADAIESVVWEIVGAMPDKIEKAGLKDSAVAVGTGIDKFRLLREQPTSISGEAGQSHIVEQTILKRSERTKEDAESIALSLLESFQDEPEFLQPELWGKFAYVLAKPKEIEGLQ